MWYSTLLNLLELRSHTGREGRERKKKKHLKPPNSPILIRIARLGIISVRNCLYFQGKGGVGSLPSEIRVGTSRLLVQISPYYFRFEGREGWEGGVDPRLASIYK